MKSRSIIAITRVSAVGVAVACALASSIAQSSDRRPLSQGMISAVGTSGLPLNNPMAVAVDEAGNIFVADTLNNAIRELTVDGRVLTVAGNGRAKYAGDNGPATAASLNHPGGLAIDAAGNLYINDENNFVVRKVGINHVITTVAGTGKAGYSGDDGPASKAQLAGALGVAVDKDGNLYIADTGNCVIRKVDKKGVISTVVGNGFAAYAGDGGPARLASLRYPTDLTFDTSGNMYIADYFNGAIRKVDTNQYISTVAGNGLQAYSGDAQAARMASLHGPVRVAVDASGNLYIETDGDGRIRQVSPDHTIATIAGSGSYGDSGDGGPAALASLRAPYGMALDRRGSALYIADTGNNRVRLVSGTAHMINVALSSSSPGPMLHNNVETGTVSAKGSSTDWYFTLPEHSMVSFRLPVAAAGSTTLHRIGAHFKVIENPATVELDAGSYYLEMSASGHATVTPRSGDTLASRLAD